MDGPAFVAETSPDQRRVEDWLVAHVRPGDTVLHVGIGRSSLARRLVGVPVHGVTIRPEELAAAPDLPGYTVALADKHAGPLGGPYDWIVDNNPTSYACCVLHARGYFARLGALLRPGGRFLTDREGLRWHEPHGFGIGWTVFSWWGRPLVAEHLTPRVWALRRPPG